MSIGVLLLAAGCYVFVDRPVAEFGRAFAEQYKRTQRVVGDLGHGRYFFTTALLLLIAAIALRWRRVAYYAALGLVSLCAAGVTGVLLKVVLGRYRPSALWSDDLWGFAFFSTRYHANSFPSGHSINALVVTTVLCLALPRLKALWIPLGLLAAFGRVLSNSHFISDIIVGGFLGVAITLLMQPVIYDNVPWFRTGAARPWIQIQPLPWRRCDRKTSAT